MTTIDVQELTKDYGSLRAVDRLTFCVRAGRVTGFLGPNGAGKSTTMRLVLGLDRPTSGTATLGGTPYSRIDEPLRMVGTLLDARAAHGSRTARDHLLALVAGNRIPACRVTEVLTEVGLADVATRRVRTFSLGMRQRLGIAAALLGDPPVLMLDEPSNGLDPEGIVWIRGLLRRMAEEGRTVLVSSHLMTETASYADHLLVLGKGRLLADSPMGDFIDAHVPPRVRLRTTQPGRLRAVLRGAGLNAVVEEDGRASVAGARPAHVGALAAREGIPLLELADESATLEQAYFALTGDPAPHAAVPYPAPVEA